MLLAGHPDAYDAYVPGIANYNRLTLPPPALLWFEASTAIAPGHDPVQKTADNGHYLMPFAKILLALSARREKKDELARKYLKELSEQFPGNTVYDAEYAKALGRPIPSSIGPAN
jgi:hypothetical protein